MRRARPFVHGYHRVNDFSFLVAELERTFDGSNARLFAGRDAARQLVAYG